MRPVVLILDEPIAGLDPKGRRDIVDMISSYRHSYNATVIVISHNMDDMAVLADKLLVLCGGKLQMFDTVHNVFSKAEQLKEIGLGVPAVTEVLYKLKQKDKSVRTDIFTIDRAVEYLCEYLAGGKGA